MHITTERTTIDGCRFCYMCRDVCTAARCTREEELSPQSRALALSMVLRGSLQLAPDIADDVSQCCFCGWCRMWCEGKRDFGKAALEARKDLVDQGQVPASVAALADRLLRAVTPRARSGAGVGEAPEARGRGGAAAAGRRGPQRRRGDRPCGREPRREGGRQRPAHGRGGRQRTRVVPPRVRRGREETDPGLLRCRGSRGGPGGRGRLARDLVPVRAGHAPGPRRGPACRRRPAHRPVPAPTRPGEAPCASTGRGGTKRRTVVHDNDFLARLLPAPLLDEQRELLGMVGGVELAGMFWEREKCLSAGSWLLAETYPRVASLVARKRVGRPAGVGARAAW